MGFAVSEAAARADARARTRPLRLAILGATGSVGRSALAVAAAHPDRFEIAALAAGGNARELAALAARHRPSFAAIADAAKADELRRELAGVKGIEIGAGDDAVCAAAVRPDCDGVVAAIAGEAGLASTFAAARAGKRIYLANKESLVVAGRILLAAAARAGGEVLPLDSEHSALFQLLRAGEEARVKKIWLTASGGALFDAPLEKLGAATPREALRHPNWKMGDKITVDSATLVNKGLEVIEACALFDLPPAAVGVVIHRASVAHALVEFIDGVMTAHLSRPDMRLTIAHMLAWPERLPTGIDAPDWETLSRLTFCPVDARRFPALGLAYRALAVGGAATAVYSAANEAAVARFLGGEIGFLRIAQIIEEALDRFEAEAARARALDEILAAAAAARAFAAAARKG